MFNPDTITIHRYSRPVIQRCCRCIGENGFQVNAVVLLELQLNYTLSVFVRVPFFTIFSPFLFFTALRDRTTRARMRYVRFRAATVLLSYSKFMFPKVSHSARYPSPKRNPSAVKRSSEECSLIYC